MTTATETRVKLRCSALPRAFACPASVRSDEGEILIDPVYEAAELGTAVHAVLEHVIRDNMTDFPDLKPYADRYGCSIDELGMLATFGMQAWSDLSPSLPEPQLELEVDEPVPGHIDVFSRGDGKQAVVIDWKSGRKESDHYHQTMGYSAPFVLGRNVPVGFNGVQWEPPRFESVRCIVVWLRDRVMDTHIVTAENAADWQARLRGEVINWDGRYHPGEHCQYCPRRYTCPALREMARGTAMVLADSDQVEQIKAGLSDLEPSEIVALRRRWKVIESLGGDLERAIREIVIQRGGLDTGDGKLLAPIQIDKRELDPLAAWATLAEWFSDEELARCMTLSITKVEGAAKDQVRQANEGKPRKGAIGAAVRGLIGELEKARAISTRRSYQVKEIKRPTD